MIGFRRRRSSGVDVVYIGRYVAAKKDHIERRRWLVGRDGGEGLFEELG
jgi:hypothetical protein